MIEALSRRDRLEPSHLASRRATAPPRGAAPTRLESRELLPAGGTRDAPSWAKLSHASALSPLAVGAAAS